MAGAHFNDGNLRILADLEHGKRDANLVIEVADRCHNLVLCGKDRVYKLLGGGFSVSAGKADNRNIKLTAVVRGKGLEGFQGVRHLYQAGVIGLHSIIHHGAACSGLQGLKRKGVSVKILTLEGEEHLV